MLDPLEDFNYWDFSFDTLGKYDNVANMKYIYDYTGGKKVSFFGGKDSHTVLILIHLCADLSVCGKISRLICLKTFFSRQNIELWPFSTLIFMDQ